MYTDIIWWCYSVEFE